MIIVTIQEIIAIAENAVLRVFGKFVISISFPVLLGASASRMAGPARFGKMTGIGDDIIIMALPAGVSGAVRDVALQRYF